MTPNGGFPPITGPLPPDPSAVPKAIEGVTVIPKTPEQQKRSARWVWLASAALGLPGVLILAGSLSGQLAALFPKYGPNIIAVCSIAAAVGLHMRASQMQNSAKDAVQVDHSKEA